MSIEGGEPVKETSARSDYLSGPDAGRAAARGGALRLGGYCAGVAASTVAAAMLFRHLGVIETGQYVTALSLVALVAAVSDLGLTAIGLRELSRRTEAEQVQIASDLLGLKFTLSAIGGVVIVAIAYFAYSPQLALGVALATFGLAFTTTQDNFALRLVVELRLGWVAVLELSRSLLTATATILLVLIGAHLLPFLGMSIPVGFLVLVATGLLVRNGRSLAPTFNLRRWRAFTSTMMAYSAAVAASTLYYRVAILLVSKLANALQLGYFSASYRVIEVLTVVPLLLVNSVFPILARAARDDRNRLGYALQKVFEASLIVGAWVAMSIVITAPLAMSLLGGPNFQPADDVLAFQGIGLGTTFINVAWGYGLVSLGKYRLILAINIVSLLINIGIVTPLIKADGALGAAIGTAATEIILAYILSRALATLRPELRPLLGKIPRVLLAMALGLTPLAISSVPTLLRLVIANAIFFVTLLATRAIPQEVFDLLPMGPLRRVLTTRAPRGKI